MSYKSVCERRGARGRAGEAGTIACARGLVCSCACSCGYLATAVLRGGSCSLPVRSPTTSYLPS